MPYLCISKTQKHKIMEKYDYKKAVENDIREYIKNNDINPENYESASDCYDALYDDLFVEDSVTGNGSGSYTFNAWEAEENLCHNMDLLGEALAEFGCGPDYLEKGAEACDVTIRCYILGQVLYDVISDLWGCD